MRYPHRLSGCHMLLSPIVCLTQEAGSSESVSTGTVEKMGFLMEFCLPWSFKTWVSNQQLSHVSTGNKHTHVLTPGSPLSLIVQGLNKA